MLMEWNEGGGGRGGEGAQLLIENSTDSLKFVFKPSLILHIQIT